MRILTTLTFAVLATITFSCEGTSTDEGGANTSESIATEPDYEDSDANQNGQIDYEESSASSAVTARASSNTNFASQADSLQNYGDTLVTPTYTDDEYEAAYSTSTTNPKNQVEGGVKPGKKD